MKISCLESCLTQRKKTTRKGSDGLKATRPEKAHTSASTRQWCRMLSAELVRFWGGIKRIILAPRTSSAFEQTI